MDYEIWNTLDEKEKTALGNYKGSGYMSINENLRRGKISDTVRTIDSVMRKSRVPANTPVWRGINCSLKTLSGFDSPEQAIGRVFEHKNYSSVSRDRDISAGFGSQSLLHFTVPAGAHGVLLGGQYSSSEQEIVLPRGAMYRIDRMETNGIHSYTGKPRYVIYCTYLGTKEEGVADE